MDDLISIIIPVYNMENYLNDCFESVRSQTYRNIEIIVIDDGSKDKSAHICDEVAKIDSRFVIVHKENGGQSDARNMGLSIANGKYLMFVDSDDVVKNNYVERLYNVLIETGVDIVCSPYKKIFDKEELYKEKEYNANSIIYNNKESLEQLLYQNKMFHTGPFGKIYKKEVWDNVLFPKGMIYEDLGTTYKLLLNAQSVAGINEHLYGYRIRKDSTMRQSYNPKKLSCIPISQELYRIVSEECPELSAAAATRCFSVNRAIFWQLSSKNKGYNDVWNEVIKYRKTVMMNKDARTRDRIMAAVSFLGKNVFHLWALLYRIQQMGRIY